MLQKDTRSLVAAAIAARPDAVYLTGYGPAYMASLRQLRELAPHMPVLADSTFADPATLAALGSAAEGVVFTGTDNELGDAAPAQVAAFRKAFTARHGREPYSPAVFSHDAVRLLADVAWRDGKVAAPTKADVLARSPVAGVLGNIVIDAEGESSFASRLLKIDQGRIVPVP
jgi:ABC-type branched-subunit amino acid transport system substrate-binding protein